MHRTSKTITITLCFFCFTSFLKEIRVSISNSWGTIDVPVEMEVQSGDYKNINDKNKLKTIGRTDLLVLQQKGLNNFKENAFGNYARILIDDKKVEKELSSINKIKFTPQILKYLKNTLMTETESNLKAQGVKFLTSLIFQ